MIVKKLLGTLTFIVALLFVTAPAVQADNHGGTVGEAITTTSYTWHPTTPDGCLDKVYIFRLKVGPHGTLEPRTRLQASLARDDIRVPKMVTPHKKMTKDGSLVFIWRVRVGDNSELLGAWVRVDGNGIRPRKSHELVCGEVVAPEPLP